jgi:hypothetical protein
MAVAMTSLGVDGAAPHVTISGGTADQRAMASWAVDRFAAVGLALPVLRIRYHDDPSGCRDRLGFYKDGIVDVCGTHTNLMARRGLVHEMAHGWLEANLGADRRAQFLQLRKLRTWNDWSAPWDRRGFEHAAEIMGWALCDQGLGTDLPLLPDNEPEQLASAYRLLTGRRLPAAATTWLT